MLDAQLLCRESSPFLVLVVPPGDPAFGDFGRGRPRWSFEICHCVVSCAYIDQEDDVLPENRYLIVSRVRVFFFFFGGKDS